MSSNESTPGGSETRKPEGRPFDKNLIKTHFLKSKQLWSAHVTWRGYDMQEYGETRFTAIHFLLTRHKEWFSKLSNE